MLGAIWNDADCVQMTQAMDAATFDSDGSLCPPFELIDSCIDNLSASLEVILSDCVSTDAIPGETCLTPEKFAQAMSRATIARYDELAN